MVRRVLTVSLALLLVASSLFMAYRVHSQMRENIISQHSEKLTDVVNSIDRYAYNQFYSYRKTLEYVTGRGGFMEAENRWLQTGSPEKLLFHMEEILLTQEMQIKTFLAIKDGTVVLSMDGSTNYTLPDNPEDIFICNDDTQTYYLGVSLPRQEISYAVLIDLNVFCEYIAENCAVNDSDRMILMDRNKELVICRRDGATAVQLPTAEVLSKSPARLLAWHAIGTASREVSHYEMEDHEGAATMGYALIGDKGSQNGFFTVCILDAYDSHLQDLKRETMQLVACFGVLLLGLILFLSYITAVSRKTRQAEKEVAQLKERQIALEKINEQTQQLAHHQRLETIGTLTSSISHEFNNLLTPIMSYSLLTLEKLPASESELYDNVLEIYNASQKAKVIISRLSDLSRKNSPRSFRQVSVDDLIKKTLDIAMPAKPEGVEVRLNLNCTDLRIHANEIQICQLLLNLIINAFQVMENGGTLEIHTVYDDDNIRLSITDTGCGIPEAIRERIFEPFFTTKESGKGTGLGLAIVAQVVEDHKGTVQVLTPDAGGTSFLIHLPRGAQVN